MPRKKPAPESEPVRTTVSLPYYVGQAAGRFENLHRELALKGFSDLVARALGEYIEKHHPGLIAEVESDLRAAAIAPAPVDLIAAEDAAAYETGQTLAARHEQARVTAKSRSTRGEGAARGKAAPAKRS